MADSPYEIAAFIAELNELDDRAEIEGKDCPEVPWLKFEETDQWWANPHYTGPKVPAPNWEEDLKIWSYYDDK